MPLPSNQPASGLFQNNLAPPTLPAKNIRGHDCPILHNHCRCNNLLTLCCLLIHCRQCDNVDFAKKQGKISKQMYFFSYFLITTITNLLSGMSWIFKAINASNSLSLLAIDAKYHGTKGQ
jgi:hypothetical protein